MIRSSIPDPRNGVELLVTGTGSLAETVLYTFATCPPARRDAPLRIAVAGRNAERARWLALAANARAVSLGLETRFTAERIDWQSSDDIARLIDQTMPALILHTASLQSPWTLGKADAWSRLVAKAGYGITASLHAELLLRLARALRAVGSQSLLVNACYPDSVNVMIARLRLPISMGIGNVAILAAVLTADRGAGRPGAVKVLANHWHVAQCIRPKAERTGVPRIWFNGTEVGDAAAHLAGLRLPSDAALNWVTGATAVPLLLALLDQSDGYFGHAPGPLGLPGGYPVAVRGRDIHLDLPPGISQYEAVEWNRSAEILDGMSMDEHGFVRYSDSGAAALAEHSPALAAGFPVAQIDAAAREMAALRRSLEAR